MITVAGGTYLERCVRPAWDQLYGSGGRAATALAELGKVELHTYVDEAHRDDLDARMRSVGCTLSSYPIEQTISFHYAHPLSIPVIVPSPMCLKPAETLALSGQVVLRFGMLEGDARVTGERVIYDPQSAWNPKLFRENGSSATHLAVVANGREVRQMTGVVDLNEAAERLRQIEAAEVVVVKAGSRGAIIATDTGTTTVSAYRTELVFGIGSGDVFAAAFAHFWGVERLDPTAAADLASRSAANYCATRSPGLLGSENLKTGTLTPASLRPGRVYLAGPFFCLSQRWLVEEARAHLLEMGLDVFSPIHDVGPGPAHFVAEADLDGLGQCDRMLALLDGGDTGTLFEVGYARARGMPVVALAETLSEEQLKMVLGSGCKHFDDFTAALYATAWRD